MSQLAFAQSGRIKTVLLFEDEPDVATFLRTLVQLQGYHVIESAVAETAIRLADTRHIDLLIADVMSPSSGVHVAVQLRTRIPDLRVILTSGYTPDHWNEEQRFELAQIPPDSVRMLRKPFPAEELFRMVRGLIGPAVDSPNVAGAGQQ